MLRKKVKEAGKGLTLKMLMADLVMFNKLSEKNISFRRARETAPDLLRSLRYSGN